MATGITKTVELTPTNYGSHKAVKVTVVYTETYDVNTNQSTINYTVRLTKNSWATSFYATQNKIRVKLTINGVQRIIPIPAYHYSYSWNGKITTPSSTTYNGGTSISFPASYDITYADSTKSNGQSSPPIGGTNLGAVIVDHNSDGTKSITITTAIEDDHSSSTTFTTGAASKTETVILTPIARASTFTLSSSSVTLNNSNVNQTITITRASTNFTHKLYYTFGTQTSHAAIDTTGTITTSKVWTLVPSTMLAKIPSATSGTCTVYCDTYNGNTKVGTTSKTFTISVDTSIVPSLSNVGQITEGNQNLTNKNFGTLIQNYSIPTMQMDSAIPGTGSSINSYELIVDGPGSLDYAYYYTTVAGVISAINAIPVSDTGTYTIYIKCWDERNRESAQVSRSFTVTAYTPPNIIIDSSASGRYNTGGAQDDEGTKFKIQATYTKTNINSKNLSTALTIKWKEKTASTYPSENTWPSSSLPGSTEISKTILSDLLPLGTKTIDISKSYDIQITYTDSVTSVVKTITIASAFALFDINNSGYALAFGKASRLTNNDSLMEIAMPVEFSNQTNTTPLLSMGLLDLIYPIGAIYISTSSTSPATLFGGTWTPINGRFLVAQGNNGASGDENLNKTANTTGGKSTVTLTSSQCAMPSHQHSGTTGGGGNHRHTLGMNSGTVASGSSYARPRGSEEVTPQGYNSSYSGNHSHSFTTNNTSIATASSSHENLPPYLAVYMWERTL